MSRTPLTCLRHQHAHVALFCFLRAHETTQRGLCELLEIPAVMSKSLKLNVHWRKHFFKHHLQLNEPFSTWINWFSRLRVWLVSSWIKLAVSVLIVKHVLWQGFLNICQTCITYICVCVLYSSRAIMFNEDEDWNDEPDAQILSKTVLKNTQKENSSTNVKVFIKMSLVTCCRKVVLISRLRSLSILSMI